MDFPDLKQRNLKQKPRRIGNWRERWEVEKAMSLLWGRDISTDLINKIEGLEFLGFQYNTDCKKYAIGDVDPKVLAPGVLEHTGIPKTGDVVVYGYLSTPRHIGIWQEDGRVLSQWGDNGPIMVHKWNQVALFDFGRYVFFSTYQSDRRYKKSNQVS